MRLMAVAVAAAVGGMVNSIAGGGTLLTFPALIALGVPPLVANATSTVALWPGALSSMYGYRAHLRGLLRWSLIFALPSLLGGGVGAWLLLNTSESRFEAIVPWLVLGATFLFAVQGPIMRRFGQVRRSALSVELSPPHVAPPHVAPVLTPRHGPTALLWQFLVGVYGGYFGAGIGILMLAVLGFMGFTDIHRMNGLKNWGGLCINFVAAVMFAVSGIVNWAVALAMAVGAIAGGYAAAHVAQRVPQVVVRRAIIVVGIASGLWLMWAPL
jgi:uncharacterized membrane protein YfcA